MRFSAASAALFSILLLLPSGCGLGERAVLDSIEEIPAPESSANSGEPNLAVGPDGSVLLSWIESGGVDAPSLKFASRTAEGWSKPQTIVSNDRLLVNWADFPSLFAFPDGEMAAHWLVTIPETEGYSVNIAVSSDKGATWGTPVTPHHDSTPTEHGFVSLAPARDGVSVLWLDSRKLDGGSDEVALMNTRVGLDGSLSDESVVDERVCECCQPSSIPVAGGFLAVYRDRSKDEIRDIAITRFDGAKWSAPKIVAEDKWQIYACPIQGPAISAAGDNVVVAWFTSANDKPRLQVVLSKDGGNTFGAPVQVDDGNPIGRVDAVALENGGAVITWIEHSPNGGEVRARQVGSSGKKFDARTLGKTSVGNASGFPRVERSGETIVFAWTDTEAHRVKTASSAAR